MTRATSSKLPIKNATRCIRKISLRVMDLGRTSCTHRSGLTGLPGVRGITPSIYENILDQAANRRMKMLEWVIIILIALSIGIELSH